VMRIAPIVGASKADSLAWAQNGLDHVLAEGRAPEGSIVEMPTKRTRQWWVQGEAIQLLLMVAASVPDPERYVGAYDKLMAAIDRQFIDRENKGWESLGRSDWPLRVKLGLSRLPKGHRWKDASHETDAYLTGIRILRGLSESEAVS
jgi:hypothetical protein